MKAILARGMALAMGALLLAACRGDQQMGAVRASGFLQAPQYRLASALGGEVVEVTVQEGQAVEAGAVIVRLDERNWRARLQEAQAAVQAAQAELQRLEEGPGERALAEAEGRVAVAQAQVRAARAALEALWEAYAPLEPPQEALQEAQAALDLAEAGLRRAQAQREQVRAGAADFELQAAKAMVAAAQAALRAVELQRAELEIAAPIDGVVAQVFVSTGEVAAPGEELVRLMDPQQLDVVVYVPQGQVVELQVGDGAQIFVDAYPERAFSGRLRRIGAQAVFTPTKVQTTEERVKIVFPLTVEVLDSQGLLRAGMPADVVFASQP